MEEANDLVPPDAMDWFIVQLREYRKNSDNAKIEFYVQDGYLDRWWGAPVNKRKGRHRIRTRKNV